MQHEHGGHELQSIVGMKGVIYHGGNGYFYHHHFTARNRRFEYYRCIHYENRLSPCRGRAYTTKGGVRLFHTGQHTHDPDPQFPLEVALRHAVMNRVRSGDPASYSDIIMDEGMRGRYPLAVRARLQPTRLRTALQRARRENLPPIPHDLGTLGLVLMQEEYQYLTRMDDGENIFSGMCGNAADRTLSLVFISPTMREFLASRQQVFCDGTFKTRPSVPESAQIWNIIGLRRFHVIPAVRVLMVSKLEAAYTILLRFLKRLVPAFNPTSVMCDHEKGLKNAWRAVHPRARILTCLWHFTRAVTGMARELGLTGFLNEYREAKSIVRSLGALPLLPTHLLGHGLVALGQEALLLGFMDELRPLFEYMEDEWMPVRSTLSVYGSKDRTNNACESANRALLETVKQLRPNVFILIGAFKKKEDRAKVDLETLRQFRNPSRKRRSSALANDAYVTALWEELASGEIGILRFLHKVSRRIQNIFEDFLNNGN